MIYVLYGLLDQWSLMPAVKLSQILRVDCQREFCVAFRHGRSNTPIEKRHRVISSQRAVRRKKCYHNLVQNLATNLVSFSFPKISANFCCLPQDEQIRMICIFVVGYLTALMFYFRAFYSFPVQHKDWELTYWTSKDNLVTFGSAQYIHYTYFHIVYSNTSKENSAVHPLLKTSPLEEKI